MARGLRNFFVWLVQARQMKLPGSGVLPDLDAPPSVPYFLDDLTGLSDYAAGYNGQGNTFSMTADFLLRNIRFQTYTTTGTFRISVLEVQNAARGNAVQDVLAEVDGYTLSNVGWNEVALPEPVTLINNVFYAIVIQRTDSTATAIPGLRRWGNAANYTGQQTNHAFERCWRTRSLDAFALSDVNEYPTSDPIAIDWNGDLL